MMLVVPVAILVHAGLHDGSWPEAWVLGLLPATALLGAVLGARVGLRVPDVVILRVFFGLLCVISARYAFDLLRRM
jgi:uncharacterized membrane protein YfcA